MAAARALGARVERRVGSSPTPPTTKKELLCLGNSLYQQQQLLSSARLRTLAIICLPNYQR